MEGDALDDPVPPAVRLERADRVLEVPSVDDPMDQISANCSDRPSSLREGVEFRGAQSPIDDAVLAYAKPEPRGMAGQRPNVEVRRVLAQPLERALDPVKLSAGADPSQVPLGSGRDLEMRHPTS